MTYPFFAKRRKSSYLSIISISLVINFNVLDMPGVIAGTVHCPVHSWSLPGF